MEVNSDQTDIHLRTHKRYVICCLNGRPVIVNLEGFDPDDAQRIMDFISGCIYAINGKYHQISKYIFIFSPENVDISGDSLSFDGAQSSMPVINREF